MKAKSVRFTIVVTIAMLGLVPLYCGYSTAQESPASLPPDERALPSTMHCPVEGHEVADRRHGVEWRGKRYYMGTEICQEKFLADPETYARDIEPRAALFHSQDPSNPRYGMGVLWASIFVVFGFSTGAGASYIAVQKGYPGWPWFVTGFVFSLLGLLLAMSKQQREMAVSAPGLRKIPATHGPRPCPQCANAVHPAATRCPTCGKDIEPMYEAEAGRA